MHRTAFLCVNSGPEAHYIYPNGDEVSNFEIVYICRKWHGELKATDGEMEEDICESTCFFWITLPWICLEYNPIIYDYP